MSFPPSEMTLFPQLFNMGEMSLIGEKIENLLVSKASLTKFSRTQNSNSVNY